MLATSNASAYPWMIRHEYTACATCHADPSGGSLLTAYGRAQGELLLPTRWGKSADDDPGRAVEFAYGVIPLPEQLLVQASYRSLYLRRSTPSSPASSRFLVMQADLMSHVTLGRFVAASSVGYVDEGAFGAALTRGAEHKAVSRFHWLGLKLGEEDEWQVRVGRMNLPFGIRNLEHTSFVRSETRTDTNASQQHGVSLFYGKDKLRAEAMVFGGNYQVSPTRFRSAGYSAYAEYAAANRLTLGASSLVSHADEDLVLRTPAFRHAHGAFARYAPVKQVVVMAEADALYTSQLPPGKNALGHVTRLAVDMEPTQGLHLVPAFETLVRDSDRDGVSYSTWLTLDWFVYSHLEVRADAVLQRLDAGGRSTTATALLGQFHLYL